MQEMEVNSETRFIKVMKTPKVFYEIQHTPVYAKIGETPNISNYLENQRSADMYTVYHKTWGKMYSYALAPEINVVFIGV